MTRDELIDRTKRLIADGDGLLAAPSLEALRTWLQRSDELLAAAWGSMDRYHLAWLMVGKPKGTVRGRPMTPDEEAAYVREVAAQKTSALRMSLDAVERQGMPFRGETGGIGIGPGARRGAGRCGPGARPLRPPVRGRRPRRARPPGPRGGRAPRRSRRAARAATRADAAMIGARSASMIAPDPIARDYILLALRLDRLIPGLVDGYFGPAELRSQVEAESPRTPARLREDAADLRARVAAEVAERGPPALAGRPARGARDAGARARRGPAALPGARHGPASTSRRSARTRPSSRPPPRTSRGCSPGMGRWPSGRPPGTPASRSRRTGCGP